MNASSAYRETAQLLAGHGLFTESSADKALQQCLANHNDQWWSIAALVALSDAPRAIIVDAYEGFGSDEDFGSLLTELSRMSQGAWNPRDIEITVSPEDSSGSLRFSDPAGTHQFDFTYDGGSLDEKLLGSLLGHLRKFLDGVAVTASQDTGAEIYWIPLECAQAISSIQEKADCSYFLVQEQA